MLGTSQRRSEDQETLERYLVVKVTSNDKPLCFSRINKQYIW